MLREIFGTKREEVTDRPIKLHSDLCCSTNMIGGDHMKDDEIGRTCNTYGGFGGET